MGRIAGVDYGTVRIGLAVSDPSQILASPKGRIPAGKTIEDSVKNLLKELEELEIDEFVVGLPLLMSGKDSDTTRRVRKFANLLEEQTKKPVILFDERLTSKAVERMMIDDNVKRKKRAMHVDTLSATLILQNYLDTRP